MIDYYPTVNETGNFDGTEEEIRLAERIRQLEDELASKEHLLDYALWRLSHPAVERLP